MTISEASGHATATDDDIDADRITGVRFDDVPDVDADAEVDPNWLRLRGGLDLPVAYMPPSMAGARSAWIRAVAIGLAAMFVAATAAGVCLTYGPPSAWF